jgi:hypothetical protein
MALDARSLKRIEAVPVSAGVGRSLYLYSAPSADTVANCLTAGYFNGATKALRKNDLILASAWNGATPTCTLLTVTSADGAATVTTAAAIFA